MSFPLQLIVGEKTFDAQSSSGSPSRINAASSLATPDLLLIRHAVEKNAKAGITTDRHTVTNSVTILDANGVSWTFQANTSLVIPRTAAIVKADVAKAMAAVFGIFLADDFAGMGLVAANQTGVNKLDDILLGMS